MGGRLCARKRHNKRHARTWSGHDTAALWREKFDAENTPRRERSSNLAARSRRAAADLHRWNPIL
jgi:hypothetical protein